MALAPEKGSGLFLSYTAWCRLAGVVRLRANDCGSGIGTPEGSAGMKRRLTYAGIVVATMVLTTLLQPLTYLSTLSTFAQPSGCQTFKETGKTVCGKFLAYWQQHGGLAQQGYPISQEFTEKSELDSKEYTVQYFERAVFELHPENAPPYDVLLSQLGTFRYRQKYPNAEPTPAPPAAAQHARNAGAARYYHARAEWRWLR